MSSRSEFASVYELINQSINQSINLPRAGASSSFPHPQPEIINRTINCCDVTTIKESGHAGESAVNQANQGIARTRRTSGSREPGEPRTNGRCRIAGQARAKELESSR